MGFYIGFDEAKRQREGVARRKKEEKDIANFKKGIAAKTMPPPDPRYSDGTIPEKIGTGLYRYKGLIGRPSWKTKKQPVQKATVGYGK